MAESVADHNHQLAFPRLTRDDFVRLKGLIHRECGIRLNEGRKVMLEARLRRRLRDVHMQSFAEYCDYVFSPKGMRQELFLMLDEITTNKTDFFREPRHFAYLTRTALPELMDDSVTGVNRDLMVWSAGCSTGEEPYTIAMVLNEFSERLRTFRYTILATDISTKVLERACRGVYREDRAAQVPALYRVKYLMRAKDRSMQRVRIVPEIRAKVRFRRLNFMEGDFGMREPMDVIFCRNVIIYFDRANQEKLLRRLCGHLRTGGYLFTGHSETLNGFDLPLLPAASTIYRKAG